MILEDWLAADPARRPRSAHLWLGEDWRGANPQLTYGVGWSPGTGELYAVDELDDVEVVAVVGADELNVALAGWEAAAPLPGSLHWLRVAAHHSMRAGPEVAEPGADVHAIADMEAAVQRAPDLPFEEWMALDPDRGAPHRDLGTAWRGEAGEPPRALRWVPTTGELYLSERLEGGRGGLVEVLAVVPDEDTLAARLDGWDARVGDPGGVYWLRATVARPSALAQAADLENSASAAIEPRPDGPAWSLPAAPVARVIRAIQASTDGDLDEVARGIDVDPEWAQQVVAGDLAEVDLPHIQQLCEALHCSPYDLWGHDDAPRILHAYGPELWPRYIEPLVLPDVFSPPDLSEPPALEGLDFDL